MGICNVRVGFINHDPITIKCQLILSAGGYHLALLALPTKARIIVFRFLIEYSSFRDFGPYVIGLFSYEDF
jgi:hypothetical protein